MLDCARYLSEIGKPVWIRRVVVPDLTDSEEDLHLTGEFIKSLKNVKKIEALPYHSMGAAKWRALGLEYSLGETMPPTEDALSKARELLTC